MKGAQGKPTPLSRERELAFTFAQEAVKQIITLSVAIFTLTLTFIKDISPAHSNKTLLEIAWGAYLLSTLCGICTLMSLAGQLDRADEPTIYASGVKVFAITQALLFITALGLTLAFGVSAT